MTDKKQRKQRNGKKREGVVFPIAESLNNLPQAYSSFLVEVLYPSPLKLRGCWLRSFSPIT